MTSPTDHSADTAIDHLFKPAHALGLDPERLHAIDTLLQNGIRDQLFPAAVYLIMRRGLIAARGALGVAQPDAAPPRLADLDTIFDLASITKSFTAVLLLQCAEDGLLHLEQELKSLLPEAEKSPVGVATLRQLATHVSGLPAWRPVYKAASPLAEILATPLEGEPGTKYTYSDLGYITLGLLLERVTGKPLAQLAHDRIFAPLGMARTGYNLDPSLHPLFAATTAPLGEVHDPNARGMKGVAGHAGIFSNAPDLSRFCLALMSPTAAAHLGIKPILGPLARRLACTRQTNPPLEGHTIGWFASPSGYLPRGDLLSDQSFGHTGFTGTSLVFDPENDLTLLLLTNRVYYENVNDGKGVLRLRRLFSNMVGGAVR